MAQLAGVRHTYMDTVRREDLLDRISDVSPDRNYLTTTLPVTEFSQTLTEWAEYYEARPTSNTGVVEGNDNTYADLSQPTKYNNVLQIIKETFAVSETDIAVNKVSPRDAYASELGKAMGRWKSRMEFAILRGTKASGASGVARTMDGIIPFTIDNGTYTVRNSGTSLSQQEFTDMSVESWNTTDEHLVNLLLTTGTVKTAFSNFFTTSTPKTIAADDKRLVQALEVIEDNFGNMVQIRAHKDMPASTVLGVNTKLLSIGYLTNRRPKHVANGITGDNRKGHIVGEGAIRVASARPFYYREGYNL